MGINYSGFKSYDELLRFAKRLENDEQRRQLICNYLILL